MSVKHPIISVTGSSGAGTTTIKATFERIFGREKITAAWIEGDAFHRFDRLEMRRAMEDAAAAVGRRRLPRLHQRTGTHQSSL